jgi:hypothetical protein
MKVNDSILMLGFVMAIGVLSITQFGIPLAQQAFAASSNQEDNSGPDKDCKQEGPGNVDHDASCKNGVESENNDKEQNEN